MSFVRLSVPSAEDVFNESLRTIDRALIINMVDPKLLGPFARKFIEGNGEAWEPGPDFDDSCFTRFRAETYFFYGTLMDPATLAKVLKLDHHPSLQPATVFGYHCKFWGSSPGYPALLGGPQDNPIHGVAYVVQTPEHKALLEAYETHRYRNAGVILELADGTEIDGRTFKWNKSYRNNTKLRESMFELENLRAVLVEQREEQSTNQASYGN